jgi:hypothetical protein
MLDAGMEMGPAQGSGWYIADTHGTRSKVVVHRPHKATGTHYIMLKDIGNRFRKHFGWDRDTFVLRTKDNPEAEQE